MSQFVPAIAARLQSPREFERFYDQARLSVFRYVMVLCAGDQAEAEDVTAEAFLRAWQKRAGFTGGEREALGWVITIARNHLIDLRRAAGRAPLDAELDEDAGNDAAGLEDLLVDGEQLQAVLQAIAGLPFPQGDIITLRFTLGWPVKAIAQHLGMSENTASVTLRRALEKLRGRLAETEELDIE